MNTTANTGNPQQLADRRRKLLMGYDLVSCYLMVRGRFDRSLRKYVEFALKLVRYQFLSHYFGAVPAWRMQLRKLGRQRTLPDFCVIGAIKSGTSDLAINLMLHPNVLVPFSKEFDDADPQDWRNYYPTAGAKQRHADRTGVALAPYLSPFLHRADVAHNLVRVRPDCKVVLVLRDPVKRFYSHWKWEVLFAGRQGAERHPFLKTFPAFVDEALKTFGNAPMHSPCGFDPIKTSLYPRAVAGWIAAFGRDKVLVMDAADYYKDRDGCLDRIYRFVGLPAFDNPLRADPVLENPLELPPADQASMARLSEFFRPHNEQLWEVIGERFDWS